MKIIPDCGPRLRRPPTTTVECSQPRLSCMHLSICTILQVENKPPIRTSQRQNEPISFRNSADWQKQVKLWKQQKRKALRSMSRIPFSRDSGDGRHLEISSIATATFWSLQTPTIITCGGQAEFGSGFCGPPPSTNEMRWYDREFYLYVNGREVSLLARVRLFWVRKQNRKDVCTVHM